MWDNECEARTWELMGGYVHDKGKPTLEEQEEVANWLNQMMPYPSWRFRLTYNRTYWVVSSTAMVGAIAGGVLADNEYTHGSSDMKADTLIELITKLEMGL